MKEPDALCDVISLAVQAVGGAKASQGANLEEVTVGGNIVLGGLVFQLSILTLYCILAIEYCVRYMRNRPPQRFTMEQRSFLDRGELTRKIQLMLAGLALNSVCLFIRAVYRTIELSEGWTGRIIQTQLYFNVLDGAMIVLAIYTFNFAHPGKLLEANSSKRLLPTNHLEAKEGYTPRIA